MNNTEQEELLFTRLQGLNYAGEEAVGRTDRKLEDGRTVPAGVTEGQVEDRRVEGGVVSQRLWFCSLNSASIRPASRLSLRLEQTVDWPDGTGSADRSWISFTGAGDGPARETPPAGATGTHTHPEGRSLLDDGGQLRQADVHGQVPRLPGEETQASPRGSSPAGQDQQ